MLNIGYNGKYIEEPVNTKFLGLQSDNHLNWTIILINCSKLSGACYAVRCVCHTINPDTIISVCFAYFHSIMNYGITFWGYSCNSKEIFTLQKKTIRLMAGVKPRNSCRSLFKRSESPTLPCEYIFSLLRFNVTNQEYFQTNSALHSINTRNKNQLHKPIANPTYQVFKRVLIMVVHKFLTAYHLVSQVLYIKRNNLK
jgi:hypothetical protein